RSGSDPLGAVLDAIHMIEDDPDDVTVGYGGIPNEDGVVELDASVMEGATLRSGSVGALRSIRHPSTAARLVMERSNRVLLAGRSGRSTSAPWPRAAPWSAAPAPRGCSSSCPAGWATRP